MHGRESTLLVGRVGPALSGLRPPFPQRLQSGLYHGVPRVDL